MGRKHVGKRRNCSSRAISPFPTVFSKGLWKGVIKWEWVNLLPNNNFLDLTKFKAFADDKLYVAKIMIPVSDRVENIVGKGEKMLVTSILSFSHNVCKRLLFQARSKSWLCGKRIKTNVIIWSTLYKSFAHSLTLSQTTHFRLFHTQKVFR